MKLIYRGATYNYDPSQASVGNTGQPVRSTQLARAPHTLIYRGVTTVVDPSAPPVWATALPAVYNLIYRGTAVHVNRNAQGQAIATAQPVNSARISPAAKPSTPVAVVSSHPSVSRVHQTNLLTNLQRRLDVARERGDMALVDLLESERQQIAA